jgi:hypothetical protein
MNRPLAAWIGQALATPARKVGAHDVMGRERYIDFDAGVSGRFQAPRRDWGAHL